MSNLLCKTQHPSVKGVACYLQKSIPHPVHRYPSASGYVEWGELVKKEEAPASAPAPDFSKKRGMPESVTMAARVTDPASSHEAAQRDFGIPQGFTGLKEDILRVVGGNWMTCREIINAIFGFGPYTYDEAVGLNKVQTVALTLYREGYLERMEPTDGSLLRYRRWH